MQAPAEDSPLTSPNTDANARRRQNLVPLVGSFLKLGTIGFGGPVALVGFMHHDLVERRRSVSEETYRLALAFAQIMPGPLAAQCAIGSAISSRAFVGATRIALAFVCPSFLMVIVLSMAYVAFGGLWWVQALFYGIGAAVIAIIAIAAYKLARTTNRRDPLSWSIFAVLLVVTVLTRAELAEMFILAGLLTLVVKAPPAWLKARVPFGAAGVMALSTHPLQVSPVAAQPAGDVLLQILLFFTKAGAFVFGSGLAIVPFLYQGVVQDFHWLDERQFTDAVAVAMITQAHRSSRSRSSDFSSLVLQERHLRQSAYSCRCSSRWSCCHPGSSDTATMRNSRDLCRVPPLRQPVRSPGRSSSFGQRAIFDFATASIGLISLGVLWRFRLHEPIVVAAAALAGLLLWPPFRGGGAG